MQDLKAAGKNAAYLPDVDSIVAHVAKNAQGGDIVVVFSNGGFGGIHAQAAGAAGKKVVRLRLELFNRLDTTDHKVSDVPYSGRHRFPNASNARISGRRLAALPDPTATGLKMWHRALTCERLATQDQRSVPRLCLELFYRFDAAPANRRMLRVQTDIGFPMPAALAFLAVASLHCLTQQQPGGLCGTGLPACERLATQTRGLCHVYALNCFTASIQRPQIVGCSLFEPTSVSQCQQRSHFWPSAGAIKIKSTP